VALGREGGQFSPGGALLSEIERDPVVGKLRLIAEPWDFGPDGYQLGNFDPPWSAWNDRFRDGVRRFWRGDGLAHAEFANRFSGSRDVFGGQASRTINFVTAHDGFTLADLVSYERKHNEANLEHNEDGAADNLSWNCGVEGPTEDPKILALRARQTRNFLATLLLSAGTPIVCAGDELGRSQRGNNNAYCQDNEISWLDWTPSDPALIGFVGELNRLRQDNPVIRGEVGERLWFSSAGEPMHAPDWEAAGAHALGALLSGHERAFLLLFNGGDLPVPFRLPLVPVGIWQLRISSAPAPEAGEHRSGEVFGLQAHTLVVFERELELSSRHDG